MKKVLNFFMTRYLVSEVFIALVLITITLVMLLVNEFKDDCCPRVWVMILGMLLFSAYVAIPLLLTIITGYAIFGNSPRKHNNLLFVQIVGMVAISAISIFFYREKLRLMVLTTVDYVFLFYLTFALIRSVVYAFVLIKNHEKMKEIYVSAEEVFNDVPKARWGNTNKFLIMSVLALSVFIFFNKLGRSNVFISLGETYSIGSFLLDVLSVFYRPAKVG